MNAKEYLSQVLWLDQSINNKLEQMSRLESLAQKVTVGFVEGTGVKIIDLSHEINHDIDRLIDLKREILETISQVGDVSY